MPVTFHITQQSEKWPKSEHVYTFGTQNTQGSYTILKVEIFCENNPCQLYFYYKLSPHATTPQLYPTPGDVGNT